MRRLDPMYEREARQLDAAIERTGSPVESER